MGWFKALYASAWIRKVTPSRIRNALNNEKSAVLVWAPRTSGEILPRLPKVKFAGAVKTVVSKAAFSLSATGPSFLADLPVLLSRWPGEKIPVLLGNPLENC